MTKSQPPNKLLPWLDVLAITAWGVLMLRYWRTGKLNLLIHPNYFPLVIVAGIFLIIVGLLKAQELWRRRRRDVITSNLQHVNFFAPGWGSSLLLIAAISGFIFTPQVFASDKALQRNVTDLLSTSRLQTRDFEPPSQTEKRSLLDWVRTLSVYPEPDKYTGQKVKVKGFVIHPPEMGSEYIFLARFVLTCCAADAYPVGLPVKLSKGQDRYTPDTWLEIEGKMVTETINGQRQLTIAADSLKKIPQPENPYGD